MPVSSGSADGPWSREECINLVLRNLVQSQQCEEPLVLVCNGSRSSLHLQSRVHTLPFILGDAPLQAGNIVPMTRPRPLLCLAALFSGDGLAHLKADCEY
jgi:hypothetical protein